ncbi:hypothetical protein AVEN_43501-1 [Araneus ventricosus]|uniref:Uncharacterized protein n=1 Tax=Araneus ventricosus TaxID=182803 RepID=A0A4Y2F626_ARAVE|nr:hypothetical protein AVEN_43501-1 [Araneus ventricosus]
MACGKVLAFRIRRFYVRNPIPPKIRDSGPKGPRFKNYALPQWGLPDEVHATPTFSSTTRRQHQKSHQFHHLLHSPDGSPTTPTAELSQFRVCDTFQRTKPSRACAQTIGAAICAYALHAALGSDIKQAGGCSCSAPCCAIL